MWNQEDFFCIVKLLHFKFFSHLKKDQKGIHLICSLTLPPPRGKHSKADAHKVMLHTPSRTDWQQKPSSIWADTASSRHNSTYIASLSLSFFVSGAPLPFWYLWSSFWVSALAYGCVTGIFHPVCFFSFAENVDKHAEARCNERNLHFMWGFDLVCLQSN